MAKSIVTVSGLAAEKLDSHFRKADELASLPKREAAIRAVALLLVTKGLQACTSPSEVNKHMPEGQWFLSRKELRQATGGTWAVIKRLQQGGIIPKGALGAWSPDFWTGLKLSRVIRSNHPSRPDRLWLIRHPDAHPALLEDLEGEVPFVIKSANAKCGKTYWSLWAALMGADNPRGAGVLAGLLAGGRRVERGRKSWVGLVNQSGVVSLLDDFMIPWEDGGRDGVLVSPFWGVLVMHLMPYRSAERYRLWLRPASYPLLPWVFLAYAYGSGAERWMAPWTCNPRCLKVAKYPSGIKSLRRVGFELLKLRGVSPVIREAWIEGMASRGVMVYGEASVEATVINSR